MVDAGKLREIAKNGKEQASNNSQIFRKSPVTQSGDANRRQPKEGKIESYVIHHCREKFYQDYSLST